MVSRSTARVLSVLVAIVVATGSVAAQSPVVVPGTTSVGKRASAVTVTVTMTGSGEATAPVALTQGVAGLDFTVGAGGTCAAVSYTVGQQCTVNIVFAPKYPGQRTGAVVIQSAGGSLLGSTLLEGMATGSLSVLVPGTISTVAGDGNWIYQQDNVPAVNATIFLPTAVAVDAAGNFYLSDSNNSRVRRVDGKTGVITTVAGTGTPGFYGDQGLATRAMISLPSGLALDGAGNLYFVDTGNHAVRRIDAFSGVITTVAGTGAVQGYSGDGGLATAAKLSLPEGIAFDAAQDLYIADTGNSVIREVNATTGIITTVAGTGVPGFNGDGIQATTAWLNSPWNLTVGTDNALYIADLSNHRIRKVSPSGVITTIAGTGTMSFLGDGGPAVSADLNAPASVVFDPAGNMYIADSGNNRIREVSALTGNINTIAGIASEEFSGDGSPANVASLYGPYSLFFDQTGNLFLTDMFHNRVREISSSTLGLDYATLRVGKVSPPQKEGLGNDGNAPLTLSAPTLNNAALDPATTTCNTGLVLAAADTCSLGIEFAPTVLGNLVLGLLLVNSDAGNSPTTINLAGQVLSVNPTSVSLSSSVNPSLYGAAVTFTATIASGGASPTGNVNFLDGNVQLCSVALDANSAASCTTSSLTLGQHSITAAYVGDSSDASSVSTALIETVKQPATLVLAVSPNPSVVTASVTLMATATAATGTPTGTIVFYDGSSAIGSANLSVGGVATFSTTSLTAATHSLYAVYAGDLNNAGAQSNSVSEVVQHATTLTTLGSNQATVTVGTAITFTATVICTNGPAPTGTVQFTDGLTDLGNVKLGSNGTATLTIASLAPGTHDIIGTYIGDANDATSASTALVETVQQIGTTTVVSSSANPANAGATVMLTANVAMVAGATADGTITGKVTFSNGTATLGSVSVDANGNASLSLTNLPVGQDVIVVSYAGNTNYGSSTSASLTETINQTSTTTALISSNQSALEGKAVTFTATVTTATGTATGTVYFLDNGVNVGLGTLNAHGVATLTLSTLAVGNQSITAVYLGDSNYTTSTSSPLVEVVSLAVPTVTLDGPVSPVNAGVSLQLTGTILSGGVTPTGALTLRDGGTSIATQNAVASGSFGFSTSTLAVGTHLLTIAYAGDTNNAPVTSNIFNVIVQQAPTTTSLVSNVNPQIGGKSVTFTASTSSTSPGVTGSISFQDGGVPLGSVSLGTNGTAMFTTSSLTFGTHTITAVYSGDTNHASSTSAVMSEQIVQGASESLTSSVNPSVAGANVVFTATMAGVGGLVPTGAIIFADGATSLGSVNLSATGVATFQSATLAVGSHTITASYAGDKNYSSASATLVQTVQNASTQISLSSSSNPGIYGTPLALVATVVSDGSVATGSVSFTDGGTAIGSALLNSAGVATLTTSTLSPGSHTIVANYAGDGRASASSSTPLTQVVKQMTTVALASSVNPAQTLTTITLTAVVTNSGVGKATGSVTFTDGSTQLGVAALDATGTATLTVPSLAAGNHSVLASYAGDGSDFASISSEMTQGVQLRPTTTSLTASLTDPNNPQQVTVISVERWTGPATPTGTVTFMNGSNVIGSRPIDSTGVGTLTIVLQSGAENIYASYTGDTAYSGSVSPAVLVNGGQATQFTMSLNPPSVTLQSKQHSVVTLTVTSVQSFADTLQLGCVGLPAAASCTFTSTQMKLASGGTSTVQITVDTGDPLGSGAESASVMRKQSSGSLLCFLPVGLIAGVVLYRSRRRSLLGLLLLVFAIMGTLGVTGCSGLTVNGTPAGTYTFKVTAVGQQTGVSEAQVMTLTVTQ